MEGAAKEPKSIKRKGVPDYTFAFNESRFSDRTLQIVRYDEAKGLQDDGDANGTIEVRTVHVNSAILAESSRFFNKLFSSGMRETEQRHATIHISSSEEQALMYLLKFMYGGTIETQSTKELLEVLVLGDKFEVATCIHGCAIALDSVPWTVEFASHVLCLPSSLLTTVIMQPVAKAAEGFLLTHFCNIEYVEEYMNLPLQIIEQLLKSDELGVPSEDHIYDFAVDWAERHYHDQDQDERREMFQNKLIKLIRFPQMTDHKLAEILSNEDMHCASALKLVSEALNFKGGSSSQSYNLDDKRFCKRSYKLRPIRAIEFQTPKREYRVFWDFNKDGEQLASEYFYMWGRQFKLIFCSPNCYLYFLSESKLEFPVEYVMFFRSKLSTNDYSEVVRGKLTSVHPENNYLFYLKSNVADYNFNNIIHMQAVFI